MKNIEDIVYLEGCSDKMKPIYVDFEKYNCLNRNLTRACGVNNKDKTNILDCTAGLLKDSFILANHNCNITAIEKNQTIYKLVQNGIERGLKIEKIKLILSKINFLFMDSIDFLENCSDKFDCIYLDPMFEKSNKTRLVKKDMQIFHTLTSNSDNEKLFSLAIAKSKKRVVVKRALHGDLLVNKKPNFQIRGNTIRFDVYIVIASPIIQNSPHP
jgi:16S rRNA (guanine1516-N2)-methyltransferase